MGARARKGQAPAACACVGACVCACGLVCGVKSFGLALPSARDPALGKDFFIFQPTVYVKKILLFADYQIAALGKDFFCFLRSTVYV
jgi:hypothetical protein